MRRRIELLAVAAAVVAIGLFVLPLAIIAERYYVSSVSAVIERQANSVAFDVVGPLQRGQIPPPHWLDDDVDAGLYDAEGHKLAGNGPLTADDVVQRAIRTGDVKDTESYDNVVVAVPISQRGDVTAVVRATQDTTAVTEQITGRYALMFSLAIAALAVTWLLARRQARKLARHVEELAKAALRLGDGDFSRENRTVDIPEIDEVRTALNLTAERLDALLARERAFSAEASHQLRTPLTGLQLRLEAALRSGSSDHTPAILASLAEVDRLERTIADLLALARGTRQKGTLQLDALLSEVQEVWGPRLGSQGRDLTVRADPDLPVVAASTAAIRQVLTVLLGNAVEHGAGAVAVSVRDIEDAVAIDVADEGSVEEGAGRDLFDRREPDEEGHGIGLALARRLVEAEGGRLQLRSSNPTTLTVFLPLGALPTSGPEPMPQAVLPSLWPSRP
jgi:signal transduction histidine kinase